MTRAELCRHLDRSSAQVDRALAHLFRRGRIRRWLPAGRRRGYRYALPTPTQRSLPASAPISLAVQAFVKENPRGMPRKNLKNFKGFFDAFIKKAGDLTLAELDDLVLETHRAGRSKSSYLSWFRQLLIFGEQKGWCQNFLGPGRRFTTRRLHQRQTQPRRSWWRRLCERLLFFR